MLAVSLSVLPEDMLCHVAEPTPDDHAPKLPIMKFPHNVRVPRNRLYLVRESLGSRLASTQNPDHQTSGMRVLVPSSKH